MKPIDVYNSLGKATNMWDYTLSGRKYGEWRLDDILECLDEDGNPREWKFDKKKNPDCHSLDFVCLTYNTLKYLSNL